MPVMFAMLKVWTFSSGADWFGSTMKPSLAADPSHVASRSPLDEGGF